MACTPLLSCAIRFSWLHRAFASRTISAADSSDAGMAGRGWVGRFFAALTENAHWLKLVSFGTALVVFSTQMYGHLLSALLGFVAFVCSW